MALDKVIDLDAFRAKLRLGARARQGHCDHLRVIVDPDDGSVECEACGKTVSAFHVLVGICRRWSEIGAAITMQKQRAAAMRKMLSGYKIRLRALKALEARWWRGDMLPTCPHCARGLAPEDFADGKHSFVSREYEMARRTREPAKGWR